VLDIWLGAGALALLALLHVVAPARRSRAPAAHGRSSPAPQY